MRGRGPSAARIIGGEIDKVVLLVFMVGVSLGCWLVPWVVSLLVSVGFLVSCSGCGKEKRKKYFAVWLGRIDKVVPFGL